MNLSRRLLTPLTSFGAEEKRGRAGENHPLVSLLRSAASVEDPIEMQRASGITEARLSNLKGREARADGPLHSLSSR